MTDRDNGRSTAEQKAILAQNPLVLVELDTLLALGYQYGYEAEPIVAKDLFGDDCACYTPDPNLLREKVVGLVIKAAGPGAGTQWELYAGLVEIPQSFNVFDRYKKHMQDLLDLVNPENSVEPALLDRRVRQLGGLAPRDEADISKRMSSLELTVISGRRQD